MALPKVSVMVQKLWAQGQEQCTMFIPSRFMQRAELLSRQEEGMGGMEGLDFLSK